MSEPRMVSVKTMRDSDAYTIKNLVPSKELMRRAGEAIFKAGKWKEPVAIVCGKGNNAGDGYVVARYMKDNGIECTIVLLSDAFSEDGEFYYKEAVSVGVPVVKLEDAGGLKGFESVLDCILGTGFAGTVKEPYATAIKMINDRGREGAYIVSADINSGLNGDTGLGELYVVSDLTVSIGEFKYGHFRGVSEKAMEDKVNCDIGIVIVEE